MSAPSADRLLQRLREALAPVVREHGLDLEDVRLSTAGRRRLLRVVVDKDGGVPLDDVADVSQSVSTALDDTDLLGGAAYTLEVTSPGVDRPLTEPRHWRRAAGRLVEVRRRDGSTTTGRVRAATDTTVDLLVDEQPLTLALADVDRGLIQVEFKPGGE